MHQLLIFKGVVFVAKMTNAKKGFAIDIFYIIIIAVVIAAVIVIFVMSQTGALDMMAAAIASLLSFHP